MKYFTKEIKIALTAIVAIVLLFILINFLKGINVFKSTNTYYVRFKDIAGLTISDAVYANGYPIGIVRTIDYDYRGMENVVVGIELDKGMNVPTGTTAELETSLMGGVTMHLLLGKNPVQLLERGDTIPGGLHNGAVAQVEALMPTIVSIVPKLDSILSNLNRLTADPALAQTFAHTAELTANLAKASASLNQMMEKDMPMLMERLNASGKNVETLSGNLAAVDVEQTVQNLNATLNEAQKTADNLTSVTANLERQMSGREGTLGLLLNDRELYDNLNQTIESANLLVNDLKQNPKRYVHFSVFGRKDKQK